MYTEKTVNGYLVAESAILAMNGTNAVPGPVISNNLGGAKVVCGVVVTVAGGASAAKLNIEFSHNGVDFTPPTELIADIVATSTGSKMVLADLSNIKAPYYRLSLGGVTSLGTTGRFKLVYAAPPVETY